MFHHDRIWQVSEVASAEELARMLVDQTSTLCSGYFVAGHPDYLFLNDATHEDGAGEYGVIRGGLDADVHRQLESITFSWCTYENALAYIREALAGDMDESEFARDVLIHLETPHQHGRCRFCV